MLEVPNVLRNFLQRTLRFSLIVFPLLLIQSRNVQATDTLATPEPPARRVLERLARQMEPDLEGKPERLSQYVDLYRRELANDSRLFAFDVDTKLNNRGVVELTGFVEFSQVRDGLAGFLRVLGFTVEDQLQLLPDESLGESAFGLVKTANTLSYDRPSGRQSVETDCLLGEPLFLLREVEDSYLAHSIEGYLGYIAKADVHRVDEATFVAYQSDPGVRMLADFEAEDVLLPAGARLKFVRSKDAEVVAALPTGEEVAVPQSHCEVRSAPTEKIERIVASAKQLMGTSYLWGGKTSAGVDCSGLIQVGFATVGLNIPRDSNQQVIMGQLTGTRYHTAGMRRGDTLYFLGADGRVRHTALYLGDDRYIHAVSPVVRVNSFNPQHDDYRADLHNRFAFAKRLID